MKIIVLGGGHCQLNMIKRLKERGDYVILIDYLNDCPGRLIADEHHLESTFDHEAVKNIAKKTMAEAIITMGTDQPVLTASIASEENNLKFYIDSDAALKVTNKMVMKALFRKSDIPTVPYVLINKGFTEEEISVLKFPVVMKPVDSQGQRGIFKVKSVEEIRQNIDETFQYTRQNKVLLEEYYPNDEITVNGWVTDGKAQIISVVDRVTMDNGSRIGICIAHNHPSKHIFKYENEIINITQKIVDAFGIRKGPLYFQYLIGDKGIMVNEVAMRIGGAYEDITIPLISEIDILGMVIDSVTPVMSEKPILNYDFAKDGKYVSTQMFFVNEGTVYEFTAADELKSLPYIEEVYYNFAVGTEFKAIENATARAGYFIVTGSSYQDMINNVHDAYSNLKILNTQGVNILKHYENNQ